MVNIYALIDPFTNHVRYVGKTIRPLNHRLSGHILDQQKGHKTNWIRSLIKKGSKPTIETLEVCSDDEWEESEKFWISYFRFIGADLCNKSIGGERGALGYRKPEHLKYRSPKKHVVQFRLTAPELALVTRCAEKEGLTVRQFILTAGLERAKPVYIYDYVI